VDLQRWLGSGVAAINDWQGAFGPFEQLAYLEHAP
jgi:hypothetical protein